jgi:DNA sulfur modification protein DndE
MIYLNKIVIILLPLVLLTACMPLFSSREKISLRLHLIGDSTMADKPVQDTPERGWGQLFSLFFEPHIEVVNHAKNGKSTKSFIQEGLWAKVCAELKKGDYVFIQFGHNDAKIADTTRYAEAHTAYRSNLIKFIKEARALKAYPILLTPVARRTFSDQGVLEDAHGDYPGVVKEVAALYQVPLIDLHASSMRLLSELGPEQSERLFMRVPAGLFKALPEGKSDNTHFMEQGAAAIARLVAQDLQNLHHPLARYLKPEEQWPNPPAPPWPIPLQNDVKP